MRPAQRGVGPLLSRLEPTHHRGPIRSLVGGRPGGMPDLAPKVALQTGGREGKSFRLRNGHHSAGIGGGIHLELEGWIGFHLGEKSGELGFGHRDVFLTLRL